MPVYFTVEFYCDRGCKHGAVRFETYCDADYYRAKVEAKTY